MDELVEAIKVLAWRWVLNRLNLPACMFYEWIWNSCGNGALLMRILVAVPWAVRLLYAAVLLF